MFSIHLIHNIEYRIVDVIFKQSILKFWAKIIHIIITNIFELKEGPC